MADEKFTEWKSPGGGDQIPDAWLGQVYAYLQQHPIPTPISQIQGFSGYTIQAAPTINADESTTSTTPANLTTAGPTLTNIANGRYVVFFGASASITGGVGNPSGYMGVKVNSTEPSTGDALILDSASRVPGVFIILVNLTAAPNTLLARYWVDSGTGNYKHRWMLLLRYSS